MSTPHVVRVIPTDTAPDEPAERRGTPSLVLIAAAAIAIVALTTVTAYAIGALRPDRYAAQAEILYSSDETASTSGGPRAIATQAAILRSGTVLAPVGRPAGLSTARMRDRLSVDSGDDNVLTVRLTDPDAGRALALTRGVVDRYLAAVGTTGSAAVSVGSELVRARLDRLNGQLDRAQRRLGVTPRESPAFTLRNFEVQSLTDRVATAEDKLAELEIEGSGQRAQVVTAPFAVAGPVGPSPTRAGIFGGVVGVLLAGAVVLLLLRLRNGGRVL